MKARSGMFGLIVETIGGARVSGVLGILGILDTLGVLGVLGVLSISGARNMFFSKILVWPIVPGKQGPLDLCAMTAITTRCLISGGGIRAISV